MELSSVSPPAASPTKGADLCEIDVTNVAIHSVTLLICLCGLVGNWAVLRLLSLKGIALFIFILAVADFLFLLLALPSTLLFLLEDMSCSPIMSQVYVSFLFQLSVVSCYWALFRLTRIGAIWDIDQLCRLCCRWDLPLRLLWVVNSVQYLAFFALFTLIPMVTFLCPPQEQEQCRVALTSTFAVILLLCAAPMVISRSINFIKAKRGSKKQRPKRRDIVVFLIVLFTLLLSLWNVLQQLGYIVVSSEVFFLPICMHSSIKPFIYFLAGRCWSPCSVGSLRESLRRVFEEQKDKSARSNDYARDTGV